MAVQPLTMVVQPLPMVVQPLPTAPLLSLRVMGSNWL